MSIFRPREAASQCEGLAAYCEHLSNFAAADYWRQQARIYAYRRRALIAKYGIKCCAISHSHSTTENMGE